MPSTFYIWNFKLSMIFSNSTAQFVSNLDRNHQFRFSSWCGLNISKHLSQGVRKPSMWILTSSDTNQAAQLLEMARGLKFCILELEVLYYPSRENICKKLVFLRSCSFITFVLFSVPPGTIENKGISILKNGQYVVRNNSDHGQLSGEMWQFLYSIYGGGPELIIKQVAPTPTLAAQAQTMTTAKVEKTGSETTRSPVGEVTESVKN